MQTELLINGAFVRGEGKAESVLNPATGGKIAEVPEASLSQIEEAVAGTGLNSFDIANRARFAGSCMGCHIESSGAFLGGPTGVSAPFSSDFVHVSEQARESCDGGDSCFGISEALRTVFLPHRINVQRSFLESGLGCSVPVPPPLGAADAGAPAAAPLLPLGSKGPVRTLGGQPVTEHAH